MSETRSNLIEGATGSWEIVLGLEVHAQVASNAKLFSGAAVGFGAAPNTQVSLVDAAMPGMLPVISKHCVEQAVKTGLGLGAKINAWSRFDRKNYFYPDLPSGYQISQYKDPIVGEGTLTVERDDGSSFTVRIERLHLEQDAGKLIHDIDPNHTLVDLNRAGTALMEIVSFPDMRSPEDAAAYVKTLRAVLRALGTCDGDMEKGNLRADVNVSVRKVGAPLGTRCEIKNVNSYRYIQQAIVYEARRQVEILEDGGSHPSGDPPVRSGEGRDALHALQGGSAGLSLLPRTRPAAARAGGRVDRADQGVSPGAAGGAPRPADERLRPVVLRCAHHRLRCAARRLLRGRRQVAGRQAGGELGDQRPGRQAHRSRARDRGQPHSPQAISPSSWRLIEEGVISSKIAKEVFEHMWAGEGAPTAIVQARGLNQVSDEGELETLIEGLIAANPGQAESVKAKPQAIGWFVGQAMKATGGKANPGSINAILRRKLGVE